MNRIKFYIIFIILQFNTVNAQTIRLFIGLSLPSYNSKGEQLNFKGVRDYIKNVLKINSFNPEEHPHITLLFLGDIPVRYVYKNRSYLTLDLIQHAIMRALVDFYKIPASRPVRAQIVGANLVGRAGNRVVYQLQENPLFNSLHEILKAHLTAAFDFVGIKHSLSQHLSFFPHIALGQINNEKEVLRMKNLLNNLLNYQYFPFILTPFEIQYITLYESRSFPGGMVNYIPQNFWDLNTQMLSPITSDRLPIEIVPLQFFLTQGS